MKRCIRVKYALMFFMFLSITSYSQNTGVYSGFVADASNGEALIGANVYLDELGYGSTTNISGYFVIPSLPYGKHTLIVSYVGYETQKHTINIQGDCENCITVEMLPDVYEAGEVVVSADSVRTIERLYNKPISKISMSAKEVNRIPRVIEADLLRSLQTMPGIVAVSDFSSALYIRGGTPDQNLYLIDGTDVYNPEHAFGIFSTFNTNAIKKVDLSKGGFGAEYGGRLSSVLDVTNLDGNRNEFEGVVNMSLLSASTTLQMPLGSIGSISGSLRRTYIDYTYSKWIDEVPDYYFYDGNLKAYLDLDKKNKLTISLFNGRDVLDFKFDEDAEDSFNFLYDWGNFTASADWKHIFGSQLFSDFQLTVSRFDSHMNIQDAEVDERNKLTDYGFRGSLEYYATNDLRFKFGGEFKLLHTLYQQSFRQGEVDVERHRRNFAAYGSVNWKPTNAWEIELGARGYHFDAGEATFTDIDPRLSIKYRLTEESNLKLAGGVFHQYINRIPRLFFASIWATADENIRESTAWHAILGYQREIGAVYELEAEVYYKKYENIYQFNETLIADIEPDSFIDGKPHYNTTENLFNEGDGFSYGLELLLRKNVGNLNGWVAYTLGWTEYQFEALNDQNNFYPRHDRRSVINTVVNYDWRTSESTTWRFGLNFIYASGQPITAPGSAYYVNSTPDMQGVPRGAENDPAYNLYPAGMNEMRLPDYIRLDLSVYYEIDYDSWTLSPYLQIINAGNRKNTWFLQYNQEYEGEKVVQTVEKVNMLPLLPSLGVTIKF